MINMVMIWQNQHAYLKHEAFRYHISYRKQTKNLEYGLSLMGWYQGAMTDDLSLFRARRFEQSICLWSQSLQMLHLKVKQQSFLSITKTCCWHSTCLVLDDWLGRKHFCPKQTAIIEDFFFLARIFHSCCYFFPQAENTAIVLNPGRLLSGK